MQRSLVSRIVLTLFFGVLGSSLCFASHPSANTRTNVTVSFVFPNGSTKQKIMTYDSVLDAFRKKHLPAGVSPSGYKVDFWIYGALQALEIPFTAKTMKGQTTIEQIGEASNGTKGNWVYYVNGIKSRYHINTQMDLDVDIIKFIFKSK